MRALGVPLGEGLAPGVPLVARLGLGAWSKKGSVCVSVQENERELT